MSKKKKKKAPIDATEFYADTEAGLTGDIADQLYDQVERGDMGSVKSAQEDEGFTDATAFHTSALEEGPHLGNVAKFYDHPTAADDLYAQVERGEMGVCSEYDEEGFEDGTALHAAHERRATMTSKERKALGDGDEPSKKPKRKKRNAFIPYIVFVAVAVVITVAIWSL